MEHINIGLDTSFLSHLVVEDLKESLLEMEISFDLVEIPSCNLQSIDEKKTNLIIIPVNKIPFSKEDDRWVIAGFVKRQSCTYSSYSHTIYNEIFGVKPNGKVATTDPQLRLQIKNLRPDIIVTEENLSLALSQIKNKAIDALITDLDITESAPELLKVPIAPGDITPPSSSGIYAMVCNRLDVKTRKLAQLIHHDVTGYLSNVERGIAKKIDPSHQQETKNSTCIHCDQDRAGNYHLHIFNLINKDDPQRVQISQSTFIGLVDQALKEIGV